MQGKYVIPFSELRYTDVNRVGGKNASLGELLSQLTSAGIRVPNGFATTADAFRLFLKESNLNERINKRLESLDVEDVNELAKAGAEIRQWVEEARSRLNSKKRSVSITTGCATAPRFRWLSALRRLPKIFRTLRSPVSRKPTSM